MDGIEGPGYRRVTVKATMGERIVEAHIYLARPEAVDPDLSPIDSYKECVLSGARELDLPAEVHCRDRGGSIVARPRLMRNREVSVGRRTQLEQHNVRRFGYWSQVGHRSVRRFGYRRELDTAAPDASPASRCNATLSRTVVPLASPDTSANKLSNS